MKLYNRFQSDQFGLQHVQQTKVVRAIEATRRESLQNPKIVKRPETPEGPEALEGLERPIPVEAVVVPETARGLMQPGADIPTRPKCGPKESRSEETRR